VTPPTSVKIRSEREKGQLNRIPVSRHGGLRVVNDSRGWYT
jgi:hypothetical protein